MFVNRKGMRVRPELRPSGLIDELLSLGDFTHRDICVLVLKDAGLSVRQIAEGIGIHKGTASRQIRDARRRAARLAADQ